MDGPTIGAVGGTGTADHMNATAPGDPLSCPSMSSRPVGQGCPIKIFDGIGPKTIARDD